MHRWMRGFFEGERDGIVLVHVDDFATAEPFSTRDFPTIRDRTVGRSAKLEAQAEAGITR